MAELNSRRPMLDRIVVGFGLAAGALWAGLWKKPNVEGRWVVATFGGGDLRYRLIAIRLGLQSLANPRLVPIVVTDANMDKVLGKPVAGRVREYQSQNPRGFGLWLWKPLLLKTVLGWSGVRGVLYVDGGSELNWTPQSFERFTSWVAEAEKMGYRLWSVEGPWTDRMYTKKAVVNALALSADALNSTQVQGGTLMFANVPKARKLVDQWADITLAKDHALLADDDVALNEDPMFRAHRHDQSLLSGLAKNAGWKITPNETHWTRGVMADASSYPIWTVRNKRLTPYTWPKGIRFAEDTIFSVVKGIRARTAGGGRRL